MAGMLLPGGASAVTGAGVPPLTQSPSAPTSAQSASGIAFGPGATTAGGTGGLRSLFSLDGSGLAFWVPAALVAWAIFTYHSLPK